MVEKEVIKLNEHRLVCGDATNSKDVNILIGDCKVDLLLTDPPYGINIVKMGKNKIEGMGQIGAPGVAKPRDYLPILGDDKPFNPKHLIDLNIPSIIFGANNFAHELPNSSKWLVWFKKVSFEGKRNNFSDVELCWTNFKGTACVAYAHKWQGMIREGGRKEELNKRVHPSQKPVGLLEQMILDFTDEGDTVLDLYGGSGSTLIACEKTNRRCLMMELSGEYFNIIQKRYWDYVEGF